MEVVRKAILGCFEDSDWHLSLWFPRVARAVLGVPASISDADAQKTLLDLLAAGELESGTVDGADFAPAPFKTPTGPCPDLYVRRAIAAGFGHAR